MKVNSLHPECVLEILVIVLKYKAGEIIEEREDASFHPSIHPSVSVALGSQLMMETR